MATQNIIADSLPAYVQQNRDQILAKVLFRGGTIEKMAKQTGIKTTAAINYLDTDPVFQNGLGCSFDAQGTATLTQREIETGLIKVNMDFCPDTLLGKYAEYMVAIRATAEDLPFEEYLVESIIANINKKMEKAVWQGDTASADPSLSHFDGLLKIANAEADTVKVAIAANTSAYDAIKAVYMSIPEEVLDKGARIFVSPALFREFSQEMVEKNYYHYSGAQDENIQEFVFPGTNVRVVSTSGLSGTQNILATYYDNMFYGCDAVDDKEEVDLWFSKDDRVFKLAVRWNAGTQFAFPDAVVLGTIATPASSPARTASSTTAKAAGTAATSAPTPASEASAQA